MSQITINELRELFGDELPIEAVKILFPEKFWDGIVIEKSVDEVRAELRALSEQMAEDAAAWLDAMPLPPKPLKLIGRPARVNLLRLLWSRIKHPFGLYLHLDVVIDPRDPFAIQRVEPRFAGCYRDEAWSEGYTLTPEPRRIRA